MTTSRHESIDIIGARLVDPQAGIDKISNLYVRDGKLYHQKPSGEPGQNIISGKDFHLAVCPETANPGEIMHDFKKLPRLVGSIDEKITPIVTALYTNVFGVELIPMPNCKTANAVKLTTNVFREKIGRAHV